MSKISIILKGNLSKLNQQLSQHRLVSSEEYLVQAKSRVGALKRQWCRWFDLVWLLAEVSSSGWCGSAELGSESLVELLHALL